MGFTGSRTRLQCASTLRAGGVRPPGAGVRPGVAALDVGTLVIDAAADCLELWYRRGEQARHIHDSRAVGPPCFHVEDRDDGRIVGRLHGAVDGKRGIRGDRVRRGAQYDALASKIPAQRLLAELVATVFTESAGRIVGIGRGRARIATHQQHVVAQLLAGNLEEELVANLVCQDQSLARLGLRCDHAPIRTWMYFGGRARSAASGRGARARVGGCATLRLWCGWLRGRVRARGYEKRQERRCETSHWNPHDVRSVGCRPSGRVAAS